MDALIIDDSRAMRGIIKRIITPLGFDAIEAENGQDGLEKLKQFSDTLELILVDWNMPVMDGLQFIKILREDESDHDYDRDRTCSDGSSPAGGC